MTDAAVPVLDEQVLAQLEEELEDRRILQQFLRRYLKLLDRRVHRLDLALTTRDPEAWMDAVLSLKASSAMAGATALARAAASLQDRLTASPPAERTWPQPSERVQILGHLRSEAEATRGHLVLFLQRLSAAEEPQPPAHRG